MALFLRDDFPAPATDTQLQDTSPEIGGLWFQSGQNNNPMYVVPWDDLAHGTRSGTSKTTYFSFFYNNAAPPSANYIVKARVHAAIPTNTAHAVGIMGRCENGSLARTAYDLYYFQNTVRLERRVNGVSTALGTLSVAQWAAWSAHEFVLIMDGSRIRVLLDGVQIFDVVDPAPILAAGHAGIIGQADGYIDYIEGHSFVGAANASGTAVASAVSAVSAETEANGAGSSIANAHGVRFLTTYGDSESSATVQGVGVTFATLEGAGQAGGGTQALAQGSSVAVADGNAAGAASVAIESESFGADAHAQGSATVSGESLQTRAAKGTGAGTATSNVKGLPLYIVQVDARASGAATVTGRSPIETVTALASAKGVAAAAAVSTTAIRTATAKAAGSSTGAWTRYTPTNYRGRASGTSFAAAGGAAIAATVATTEGRADSNVLSVFLLNTDGSAQGSAEGQAEGVVLVTISTVAEAAGIAEALGVPGGSRAPDERTVEVEAAIRTIVVEALERGVVLEDLPRTIITDLLERGIALPSDDPRIVILEAQERTVET